ncbi:MAG: histidine triad nucleotide-binding protein [Candidatus Aminicenantia bacterium]
MKDCVFCEITRGKRTAKKIIEDHLIYAFEDINPQAPIHILIVPKKHLESLNDALEEDTALLGHILLMAKEIAELKGIKNGYRIVANTGAKAGQSIYHLHFHLLGGRYFSWPPG